MRVVSGIYQIVHRASGRTYIGSSYKIYLRLRAHRNALRAGTHDNCFLQAAWDAEGEEAFDFLIVAEVPVDKLIESEQFWIDCSNCLVEQGGFNISPTAGATRGLKPSAETLAKQTEARRRRAATPEGRARLLLDLEKTKTPEVQARWAANLASYLASPEGQANLALARSKITPESRVRGNAKKRGRSPPPEARKRAAEGLRKALAEPEAKERKSAGLRKRWANTSPEVKAANAARLVAARKASLITLKERPRNDIRRMSYETAEQLRAERAAGAKYTDLQEKYGINISSISDIVNRKTYACP